MCIYYIKTIFYILRLCLLRRQNFNLAEILSHFILFVVSDFDTRTSFSKINFVVVTYTMLVAQPVGWLGDYNPPSSF